MCVAGLLTYIFTHCTTRRHNEGNTDRLSSSPLKSSKVEDPAHMLPVFLLLSFFLLTSVPYALGTIPYMFEDVVWPSDVYIFINLATILTDTVHGSLFAIFYPPLHVSCCRKRRRREEQIPRSVIYRGTLTRNEGLNVNVDGVPV